MLSIIVAKAKNNVIGKDNKLLWNLPEDLKRFKKLTTGHTIIMGRKTFESIGRVLPNRKHVILSNNPDFKVDNENVEIVHSVEDLQKYIDDKEENFVIGGAMIYSLLLPQTTKLYITEVNKEFEGDTVFPKIDLDKWEEISCEFKEENGLKYSFVDYVKKRIKDKEINKIKPSNKKRLQKYCILRKYVV